MSDPYPIFGSQDVHDDDGQVIDSFFIETDAPPPLKDATEPIPPTPSTPPIRTTRLLSGTMLLDTSYTEPFLLMPMDANRLQFHMDVFSSAATPAAVDYVMIADEKAKLQLPADGSVMTSGQMFKLRHAQQDFQLDAHTGAIWVRPNPSIAGPIEISWAATTK